MTINKKIDKMDVKFKETTQQWEKLHETFKIHSNLPSERKFIYNIL